MTFNWNKLQKNLTNIFGRLNRLEQRIFNSNNSDEGSTLEVLTEYPTTDATKAGQQFIYKGRLWMYHTQAMLDDIGWGTLVSEGFPAPVDKILDFNLLAPGILDFSSPAALASSYGGVLGGVYTTEWDFLGGGRPDSYRSFPFYGDGSITITKIRNASFLVNLEDAGTTVAIFFGTKTISGEVLNDFFTQLPSTSKTVSINISGCSGKGDSDPSIATTKGYTVVT